VKCIEQSCLGLTRAMHLTELCSYAICAYAELLLIEIA